MLRQKRCKAENNVSLTLFRELSWTYIRKKNDRIREEQMALAESADAELPSVPL